MNFLRVIFLLTLFSTPLFSQWFWEEHYYEILYSGKTYYSKGKPRIEGEFTVFNKWPENLEWRIKTQHVKAIKDIGPLSPSEIRAEKINSIFKDFITLGKFAFTSKKLAEARDNGYSDTEIWDFWIKEDSAFSKAKAEGLSLDIIAEALETSKK
jgi:hypothetical protein